MNFIHFYGFQEGVLKGAKATNLFGIEEKKCTYNGYIEIV